MILAAGELNPMAHAMDINVIGGSHPIIRATEGWTILGSPILTMHMLTMVLVAFLVIWFLKLAAKSIETGPESEGNDRYLSKGRIGQLVEVIVLFLRDKAFKPLLGDDTNKFLPYLLTVFFFILFANVLGLVPILDIQHMLGLAWGDPHFAIIGGTITANLAVTVGLALIAFIIIQVHGLKSLGVKGWAEHFLGGAPVWLAPVMLPVELMGMIIKPAALAIRLFANMLAGATLIGTIMLFGMMAAQGVGWVVALGVTIPSIAFALFIMLLKLFVSLLQAFIFAFLTAVFLSQMSHHHEEGHHDEEHHPGRGALAGEPVPAKAEVVHT
jgi:F-type H+-transporting ATPase subunit a